MPRRLLCTAFALVVAATASGSARAATLGFTIYFTGAGIALQNDSDVDEITLFSLTIGDTAFNFDRTEPGFAIGGPDRSFVQVWPDQLDGFERSDVLWYSFENFMPGDRFDSVLDIDPDSGDSACCNVSGVLFNNGSAPNAEVSVTFSSGSILGALIPNTQATPDPEGDQCLQFGVCKYSLEFAAAEPGLALLVGVAVLALALRARRRAA